MYRSLFLAASCVLLSACNVLAPGQFSAPTDRVDLVEGAPVETISTPFDSALACLGTKIDSAIAFSIGNVVDATGKEQYADGGSGKFVTQGAADMIQSALFGAGVTVINRRDPNIPLAENQWGIRDLKAQRPTDFYVSGSINSLDFIPGGGVEVELAGVGPRWRQSRILVGIDLALTSAHDGRIVANSSIQKQLYAKETGFGIGRFVNDTLVYAEIGGSEREALHHTLRQILSYAAFDLIAQVSPEGDVAPCLVEIEASGRVLQNDRPQSTGDGSAFKAAMTAARDAREALNPAAQAQAPERAAASGPVYKHSKKAAQLANTATSHAARAISSADSVLSAKDAKEAAEFADAALQSMNLAIQSLRAAANEGLGGPDGDAAATLVEKAIASAQAAQKMAADMALEENNAAASAPAVVPAPAPETQQGLPVSPDDKRQGGMNP